MPVVKYNCTTQLHFSSAFIKLMPENAVFFLKCHKKASVLRLARL